jgi:hypothetical protein
MAGSKPAQYTAWCAAMHGFYARTGPISVICRGTVIADMVTSGEVGQENFKQI